MINKIPRVWFHVSISWWYENWFKNSATIWSETLQIFTKSPKVWKLPEVDDKELTQINNTRPSYSQIWGIVHSSYLANLAKFPEEAISDVQNVMFDIRVWSLLWYEAINVHIGKSAWRYTTKQAMENMRSNVEDILDYREKNSYNIKFLFENTAGQGSEIWSNLNELDILYNDYMWWLDVGFCLDTAHLRWWGIDIWIWDDFIEQWDKKIGIKQIQCIHLNDSKVPLWSRLDRHSNLGRWFIGVKKLSNVIKWACKQDIPMIIETPDDTRYKDELIIVRQIIENKFDVEKRDKENNYQDILPKFQDMVPNQNTLF